MWMDHEKVDAILKWLTPKNLQELQNFWACRVLPIVHSGLRDDCSPNDRSIKIKEQKI